MPNSSQVGSCILKLIKIGALLLVLSAIAAYILFEHWEGPVGEKAPSTAMRDAQNSLPKGDVTVSQLEAFEGDVLKDVAMLADGTTRIRQIVLWQILDGVIYYRIILMPYDAIAHQMMASPKEALFISFVTKDGKRVAPKASALRIETSSLRVAKKDDKPAAWFSDGTLPIDPKLAETVKKPVVGWLFSGRLHDRLRQL